MIQIYTDGACSNNGKPYAKASWAYVVVIDGEKESSNFGHAYGLVEGKQTNNTGELTAIKEALLYLKGKGQGGTIFSDSRYAIDSLTVWDIEKKKKGKRKENYELIKSIIDLIQSLDFEVKFEWVRGHAGNEWNDMADFLCNRLVGAY